MIITTRNKLSIYSYTRFFIIDVHLPLIKLFVIEQRQFEVYAKLFWKQRKMEKLWHYLGLLINLINHVMILSTAVYIQIIVWSIPIKTLQWHVALTAIGYQLLMAEAILAFSSINFWSKILSDKAKLVIHLILHIFGSTLAIAGVVVQMNQMDWHFNWDSNHTIFGT